MYRRRDDEQREPLRVTRKSKARADGLRPRLKNTPQDSRRARAAEGHRDEEGHGALPRR